MQITNYPWIASYPEGIKWDIPLEVQPLYHLLDETAAKHPQHLFLDFMGKKYSYGDIYQHVCHTAYGLKKHGVDKGTRVGLLLPNCPLFIITYFAILKLGGIVVNYNPLYSLRELQHQVEDSETSLMITLDVKPLYHHASTLLHTTILEKIIVGCMEDMLPFPKNILYRLKQGNHIAEVIPDPRIIPFARIMGEHKLEQSATVHPHEDIAVLQYTGGTTGVPKGAKLSHANLYSNVMQAAHWLSHLQEGEERILAVLPLFHAFAMTAIMNLGIKKAATLVLYPRFHAREIVQDIKRKKITILPAVPTLFSALMNEPKIKASDFSSLKLGFSGGAPLPRGVRKQWETMTGCPLMEGYGLTESGPIIAIQPRIPKEGSVGLPLPGTAIEICHPEQPDTALPAGDIGEICATGPQVMMGYLHKEKDTASTLHGGRLHTGDMGYIDAEGYVFVVDRLKEIIIAGGYKIYPRVVEEAIYMHSSVKEAAVVGVEDSYRGQTVKAFIVCKAGHNVSAATLQEFLKPKLAPFEIPTIIEHVDNLPKTIIGKVAKKKLRT